jgi:hypothetical protein
MALYKPFTAVSTIEQPFLSLITRADPGWARGKYWDVEYEFSNKPYFSNPYQRGSFNRLSNVYPVGQWQGGPDPLVIENLEPTVGNPVPGLYEGVATGGWA